jgi:hypothetical protein
LHTYGNNEGSKGVSTNNSAIVHDVLRCDFAEKELVRKRVFLHVFTVGVSVGLLLLTFGSCAVNKSRGSGEVLLVCSSLRTDHHLSVSNLLCHVDLR